MLTLKEFMELVDYRITEGSEYYTNVSGLYMLSSWNGEQDGYSFEIAFSTDTQQVYLVEAHDYRNGRAYRLIDPALEIDNTAWDEIKYVDLETVDDFIQKAQAILAGEDYDTRVSVPITLPDDELFRMMKMAHERDITMNQFVEEILKEAIEKDRIKKFLTDDWDDEDEDDDEEAEEWDRIADDHFSDELFEEAAPKKKKRKKSK